MKIFFEKTLPKKRLDFSTLDHNSLNNSFTINFSQKLAKIKIVEENLFF